MAERPVVYREEVVRVLFTMYDVSETLKNILATLREEDDEEEADDEG